MNSCKHKSITMIGTWSLSLLLWCTAIVAQDFLGNEDLDQAFDKKIKAQTTRDLENVVKLCRSAIEKGLDEEGAIQAKQLAASASMEHAEQLTKRIFDQTPPDPRWQKFRTDALQQLEKAAEFQPNLVSAYLMMARLHLLPNGNVDEARQAIEKAVENAGDDREQLSRALFYRASLNEDKEAQLADVNQALKIDPNNLDALKFRAVYHLSQKNTELGLADINQWLALDNVTPQDFLDTIGLLRAMGPSFDENLQTEALKLIDRALALAPEDSRFLEQRAEVLVIGKKVDEAIEVLTKLLENDPPDRQSSKQGYLMMRGGLYTEQEKYEEALADFDQVLKINPGSLAAIEARGSTLAQKGDFAGSIKEFKKMQRRMGSSNPVLMRQIGMLHNANDQPSKAVTSFNEILELLAEEKFADQPENVQREVEQQRQATWRSRGDAYLSLGKHKEAIEDYSRVLEIHRSNQEFAKQDQEIELPEDEHTLNNLAWVLATSPFDDLRDGQRAIELATKAAEATEYKEAYILSTLASAYAETGDFENAIEWIEKAKEINAQDRTEKETEQNLKQKDSLQKESEHYARKEPFRELQNADGENADGENADGENAEKEKPDAQAESDPPTEPSKEGGEKSTSEEKSFPTT